MLRVVASIQISWGSMSSSRYAVKLPRPTLAVRTLGQRQAGESWQDSEFCVKVWNKPFSCTCKSRALFKALYNAWGFYLYLVVSYSITGFLIILNLVLIKICRSLQTAIGPIPFQIKRFKINIYLQLDHGSLYTNQYT